MQDQNDLTFLHLVPIIFDLNKDLSNEWILAFWDLKLLVDRSMKFEVTSDCTCLKKLMIDMTSPINQSNSTTVATLDK